MKQKLDAYKGRKKEQEKLRIGIIHKNGTVQMIALCNQSMELQNLCARQCCGSGSGWIRKYLPKMKLAFWIGSVLEGNKLWFQNGTYSSQYMYGI